MVAMLVVAFGQSDGGGVVVVRVTSFTSVGGCVSH